jgi:hypothetical protein
MSIESLKFFRIEDPRDPIELDLVVRDVIENKRRITGLKTGKLLFDPKPRYVFLRTAPAHKREGLEDMEIPNQTRPHAIFESVQPTSGSIDGENRI